MKKFSLVLATTLSLVACHPKQNWVLDFEDEFDGASVNEEVWSIYDGPGHAGNGFRHPETYTQENGLLVITDEMIPVNVKDNTIEFKGKVYDIPAGAELSPDGNAILVSGGMAHKKQYEAGTRFVFKARCENDPSGATSAVILTWPENDWDPHGTCEESDIYETGTDPVRDTLYSYFHYGLTPSNNNGIVTQLQAVYPETDCREWHVMDYRWFRDHCEVYMDGELVLSFDDPEIIPKERHHLCIQFDAFKTVMGESKKMYVDWVRIYKLAE